MVDRRIRKARFSSRDLCALVDAVMERREDLFGRGGDPPDAQRRRRDAWQYVTERVNAVSGTHRTWEEVRKKVHDLKKSTKEKLAYNRRSWQAAGGEPSDVKTLTEFENDMIVVLGKESLEGLQPVDIGTITRCVPQNEHCGQQVISQEQHKFACRLSPTPLETENSVETSLVQGIKDENQETPSESLSTSDEWEEVVVGDEGTTIAAWRPIMISAPTPLDAVTDLNGPAFKRRLLEHGARVEQSLAFMHTTLEDGMVRLDQRLSSMQSAIEQMATPVTAAVENSLTQAVGNAGASLVNVHSIAMEALGSKLKEAVVAGFDSLGQQLHGTMSEGIKNLIEKQCSTFLQLIAYCEEMPSSSGTSEVKAVDTPVTTS